MCIYFENTDLRKTHDPLLEKKSTPWRAQRAIWGTKYNKSDSKQ